MYLIKCKRKKVCLCTVLLKVPSYLFSCLEKGFPFFFFVSFSANTRCTIFLCIHTVRAISALPPKSLMDCIDKYLARERRVVSGTIMTTGGNVVHSMD